MPTCSSSGCCLSSSMIVVVVAVSLITQVPSVQFFQILTRFGRHLAALIHAPGRFSRPGCSRADASDLPAISRIEQVHHTGPERDDTLQCRITRIIGALG